ncbi:MAG: DUF4838 domain-containing protein [Victivallales bacterium]|nr:DUF4838 domain-containing protein [Victivallales bacterium]
MPRTECILHDTPEPIVILEPSKESSMFNRIHATMLALLWASSLMAQSFFVKGPANPKPYETTAVKEMQDYLAKRIGDNRLTVAGKTPVTFQIGDTELARRQKCLSTELEDERWVIRSVGDQILINGGGTRGALYATYHFLEDFCDIHWWSDYEEHVPAASPLAIDAIDVTGKPAFLYRDIYRKPKGPNSERTAIRVRLNRDGGEGLALIPTEYGGSFAYGNPGHCHTFDDYVPYGRYGKDHPEYFSLRGGKRVGGQYQGQLCITNPALRQLFLSQLLNYIENDKAVAAKKGLVPPKIYEVSMNDNWFRCECADCRAEEEKYNPSGHYLNFVNWLAAEVAKRHSGIYISTLAYFYTQEPPKGGVRAADNVIVKLSDAETNQAASILSDWNRGFKGLLESWKGAARNLFIWDYAITFSSGVTGYPFASEFHYGDLYRTYHENNVTGIFWEHEFPHLADFYELKYFLEAKLFENPCQDVNKLIALFMDRYYGAAANCILQYRKGLDEACRRNRGHVSWFASVKSFSFIESGDIAEFQRLFDEAEKAVADDTVRFARVRHARVGLDRLCCRRGSTPLIHHGDGKGALPIYEQISSAAYTRLAETREDWIKGWESNSGMLQQYRDELASFKVRQKVLPPPKELEGRNFYDFYAQHLQSHERSLVQLVDDPASPTGKAMRSDVDRNEKRYYDLPFTIGVYDEKDQKGVADIAFTRPVGEGYNWYRLPNVHFPKKCFIYMTRQWTTQLHSDTQFAELTGQVFDIWVSVKFTGPKFFADSTDANYIYIDRVAFVEPDNK